MSKCLNPRCKNKEIVSRGLCRICYKVAHRLVYTKQTSWKDLEATRRCLESNRKTGKTAWFREAV